LVSVAICFVYGCEDVAGVRTLLGNIKGFRKPGVIPLNNPQQLIANHYKLFEAHFYFFAFEIKSKKNKCASMNLK
jgi:hypothetical protein